jgi:cell division protein FtsL
VARKPRGGALVTGGVVWIVVIAVLLASVVAINVSVLRLNLRLNELERQRAALQAENATLSSQVSSTAALSRIQRLARAAGLVPAPPGQTTYVSIRPTRAVRPRSGPVKGVWGDREASPVQG